MSALVAAAALAKGWLAALAMMAGQGALLVIVALVLTRAGRLRPAWQAAIWLVVALELALPWRPAMPWSLSDLIASFSDRSGDAAVSIAPAAADAYVTTLSWTGLAWLLLALAWTAGASFVLVRALVAQHRTVRDARRAPTAPAHAIALVRELAPRSRVRLAVGDAAVGPHVVGLLRPIIVVPPTLLDDQPLLRAALLHELAHVRRRDALGRYIQIAACALMWWFPLVRLVNRRLDLAREAACDAWVLETGSVPRPAYARLLVRMAALRSAAAPTLASHHSLDARVAAVLGPPARTRIGTAHRLVLAAWFVVALGGARTATARGHEQVCRYTPEIAEALFAAYPQADLDGDGRLSRDEACDLQAELQNASRLSPQAEDELATLLAEPLCCNCDGPEVYSGPGNCELSESRRSRAMKALVLLLGAALAACQADTTKLNEKIDKLDKKIDALIAQGGRGGPAAGAQQRPPRVEPDRSKTYSVPIDNDPFDGPADAKVTIVKAYDYACPYCERVRGTMADLHKKYGNDVRVVYKQLVVHPNTAMSGALGFCSAAKQGKGPQMDALIWDKSFKARQFDPDKCWDTDAGCPLLNGFAQELGLNMNKFKADMKGCMSVVEADMRVLRGLGIGGTPAFFVNGRFISGAVPIENFVSVIDEELKKANERIQQGTPQAQYYQQWVVDKGLKTLEPPKQ